MTKRIAVNALAINSAPSGGRTYLLNLLEELTNISGDEYQFYLLCSPRNVTIFRQKITTPYTSYVIFPSLVDSPLVRVVLEQFFLPIWLWRNKVDLLFAARNIKPLMTACPTVVGVLSMHLNYEGLNLPWWRRFYGRLVLTTSARRADAYVSISEYAGLSYIEKFTLPRERLFVAPLGFKPQQIGHNAPTPDPVGSLYLLFVSTLFPHKNVPFLMRVFARIARLHRSLSLVIVGRDVGNGLRELKELAEKLAISDRVRFMGAVTDDELMRLYDHAHVFVFPSLIEGFGLTVLEAMAHAVPVVASNRTALPELVGDGGIVLDPDDEEAWVEAILQLLENERWHCDLSARAKKRAREFTWRRTAEITLDCFRSVLDPAEKSVLT